MRTRPADALITTALHHLDPAPESDLSVAERSRVDETLARIVQTPVDEHVTTATGRPHRRRWRPLAAVGLAGAVGVAVPGLLLGGTAYGSWTPKPEALPTVDAAAAASTCLTALDRPNRGERVAVAERRGEWTYVLIAGPGSEAICLMPDELIGRDNPSPKAIFGSLDTDAPAVPTLALDGFEEATSMQGSTDEGFFLWVEGYVGSDVTGVTLLTSSGREIEASVVGGRFAAWWPANAQRSDRPAETWSYTVHLADGSTRSER